jgi:(2Fe-2S) ferredoxin
MDESPQVPALSLVPGLKKAPPRDLALPMKATLRPRPGYSAARPKLFVCINQRAPEEGVSCGPRGGCAIHAALVDALAAEPVDAEIVTARCLGTCDKGPSLRIVPNNSWFYGAHVEDVPALIGHLRVAAQEFEARPQKEDA